MSRKNILVFAVLAGLCVTACFLVVLEKAAQAKPGMKFVNSLEALSVKPSPTKTTQGTLISLDGQRRPRGVCPLKHTDVKAEISGFLSRVTVVQEFENPYSEPIEAVYTFPLPHEAAVDDMTMLIGDRTIRGQIKPREEARQIYERARDTGHTAALLDQERPNIFTQSVAGIRPNEPVKITISYVEILEYENGSYEFVFPMTVGPRYIPGAAVGKQGAGWSDDTDRVPDASRLTPPVASEGTRAGHDVSLEVTLDAGVPIDELKCVTHELDLERGSSNSALVRLKRKNEIPNRDFVLKFDVAGGKIEDALLTHRIGGEGFFTLILQPPDRVAAEDATPRELVFVLDTSGSMEGFPIEKAKECMTLALDNLHPQDTFNLITFAGDTSILFPEPVPATPQNLKKARTFLESRQGGGGTEMMTAIRAALDPSDSQEHVRVVCFMTDGYVGNDREIIGEVQKHPNARVFSFGIGNSVNRFLLDKMAECGRGKVEYVGLDDDGSAAARRFHERVRNPLLTDVSIDWGGLQVEDLEPARIPDLFGAEPVVVCGRYAGHGAGVIRLKGKMRGAEYVREIPVVFPEVEPRHDTLATLWARRRIDCLMNEIYAARNAGTPSKQLGGTVMFLGLKYRLMTEYTSFVAVEERPDAKGGKPRQVIVPVEMPVGMSYDGVGGGVPGGVPAGTLGSTGGGAPPPPPPPPAPKEDPPPPSIVRRSEGVIRGNALHRVTPVYPALGRAARISGDVVLEVVIDEQGNVASAKIVSGHPILHQSALDAARQWKFLPTLLNNVPVKTTGILTFRFDGFGKPVDLPKFHPDVLALLIRLVDPSAKPSANEAKFVQNGLANVRVELASNSAAGVEKRLEAFGLKRIPSSNGRPMMAGQVTFKNLMELAEIREIKSIAPVNRE